MKTENIKLKSLNKIAPKIIPNALLNFDNCEHRPVLIYAIAIRSLASFEGHGILMYIKKIFKMIIRHVQYSNKLRNRYSKL